MSIIQGSAMQGASRGFYPKEIEGSLRFNSGDTSYLYWEPSSAGNRKTWTWSGWVKGNLSKAGLFAAGNDITVNNNYMAIVVESDYTLRLVAYNTNAFACKTNAVFRDPSAWYHFVVAFDTTQATAANRVKIYVNGVLQSLNSPTYPNQNVEHFINNNIDHALGRMFESDYYTNGYLAEVFFIDGTAHDADDFGETKNGVWVPKNITASDFTMGTNGFHLTFEDDTEVEAFNTTLHRGNGGTQSVTGTGFSPDLVWIKNRDNADNHYLFDTVRGANRYLNSDTTGAEDYSSNDLNSFDSDGFTVGSDGGLNRSGQAIVAWQWDAGANNASTGHSSITWTGSSATQKISGLPFRPDLVWIKARNVAYGSQLFDSVRGANKRLSSNVTNAEVSDTDALMSFDSDGFILGAEDGVNDSTYTYVGWAWDAGDSDPVSNTDGDITSTVKASTANGFSIVSYSGVAATDGSTNGGNPWGIGHGLTSAPDFVIYKMRTSSNGWYVYHSSLANTEHLVLNTTAAKATETNLFQNTPPDASELYVGGWDVVNRTGNDYIAYCFHDVTGKQKFGSYSGTGATGNTVTTGFRPGFLMVKRTDTSGNSWAIWDASRNPFNTMDGALFPNSSGAEDVASTNYIDFTDTGFTIQNTSAFDNASGATYIYAAFAGSYSDYITDYNTDGSIDSRVKASDTTGFSIVSYVGTGANATVGHGLSSAPDWIVIKDRPTVNDWPVWHTSLANTEYLKLNGTNAKATGATVWNSTSPTATTFSLGSSNLANNSGKEHIAYCWTATANRSAFGSYTGNGSTTGPTVTCGFKPAWLVVKRSDGGAETWAIHDNTRSVSNPTEAELWANLSNAEQTSGTPVDLLSNGFQVKNTAGQWNTSGATYIYAAFADTREAAFWLDQSSNDNDWQPVNLDHNDTVSDSPTDNFATLNPLDAEPNLTLSDGNLRCANPADADAEMVRATIGVSSGKYYWEITCIANSAGNNFMFGIATADLSLTDYPGQDANGWGYYGANGYKFHSGSSSAYGDAYTNGDVIGVALDMDAGTLEFYKNGTSQGVAYTGISGTVFPCFADGSSSQSIEYSVNFGQQPFKYSPPE